MVFKLWFYNHKVRDNWGKIGPFKLFDQHEDEITEEVVQLSNEVAATIFVPSKFVL